MFIKVLTSIVGARCSYQSGRVYNIPDSLANALLRTAQAVRATPAPETGMMDNLVEKAVMPKAQKKKSKSKRRRKRK